ncbi:AMP-binding protein [Ruegeria atlantica]|nr:AMP-binding protein [Ruegeria atlantica]
MTELGVRPGDRIATLAWNKNGHLEIYYVLACIGVICHTINLGRHPDQIAFIINDNEVTHLFFDTTFAPLINAVSARSSSVQGCYNPTGPIPVQLMENPVNDYETRLRESPRLMTGRNWMRTRQRR